MYPSFCVCCRIYSDVYFFKKISWSKDFWGIVSEVWTKLYKLGVSLNPLFFSYFLASLIYRFHCVLYHFFFIKNHLHILDMIEIKLFFLKHKIFKFKSSIQILWYPAIQCKISYDFLYKIKAWFWMLCAYPSLLVMELLSVHACISHSSKIMPLWNKLSIEGNKIQLCYLHLDNFELYCKHIFIRMLVLLPE